MKDLYYLKYLKYKNKYLNLHSQIGGGEREGIIIIDVSELQDDKNIILTNKTLTGLIIKNDYNVYDNNIMNYLIDNLINNLVDALKNLNLETLVIDNIMMNKQDSNRLGEALSNNKKLKILIINGTSYQESYLPFIKALNINETLEELYFIDSTFNNNGATTLLTAINTNKNLKLKILCFNFINIEDTILKKILFYLLLNIKSFNRLQSSEAIILQNQLTEYNKDYRRFEKLAELI